MNHSELTNFIWNIANLIRDHYKRSKYPDVILPFTVLRRLDCVLAPTKEKVLAAHAKYQGLGAEGLDQQLRRASGFVFYNTSRYDFDRLLTGFDRPLLCAMYVDKQLGGVNAVQTLSRLNRIYPGKDDPLVLDFVNEADAIQAAFQDYYEATLLSEQTDPNVLYQLQAELDDMHFYTEEDIDAFVAAYFKGDWKNPAPLYALLDPIVARVIVLPREERLPFRHGLNSFVRLYAFLSQILPFIETDWEKRFHFYRLLLARLLQRWSDLGDALPDDLRNQVDISFYRAQKTYTGAIALENRVSELKPVGQEGYGAQPAAAERDPLSIIIEELNTIFGVQTNGDTEAAITHLQAKLAADIALEKGAEVNPPDTFRTLFDDRADEHFGDMVDAFYKFYKTVTANPQAKERFFDWLFEQYRREK